MDGQLIWPYRATRMKCSTRHFVFKITFTLKNDLRSSTLVFFKSKVHIYKLIKLHNKIQGCRPPRAFTPEGKDINGEVEQPYT